MIAADRVRHGAAMRALRISLWAGAAALLLLPAVAMKFTGEVQWTASDFRAFGLMLGVALAGFEALWRRADGVAYLLGGSVAMGAAFLLVWINLAVGIIGSEQNDANMMFAGVIAVGIGGACIARLRPGGLAWAMIATALVQTVVGGVAVAGGFGADGPVWPRAIIGTTAIFVALWLSAASLFRRATRAS